MFWNKRFGATLPKNLNLHFLLYASYDIFTSKLGWFWKISFILITFYAVISQILFQALLDLLIAQLFDEEATVLSLMIAELSENCFENMVVFKCRYLWKEQMDLKSFKAIKMMLFFSSWWGKGGDVYFWRVYSNFEKNMILNEKRSYFDK